MAQEEVRRHLRKTRICLPTFRSNYLSQFWIKRNRTTQTVTENFRAARIDTKTQRSQRYDDEQALPPHFHLSLQAPGPPQPRLRQSKRTVPPRSQRARHRWREHLATVVWPNLPRSRSQPLRRPQARRGHWCNEVPFDDQICE